MRVAPGGDDARPGSRLRPLSIKELNVGADQALQDALGPLWVLGEISRFTAHRSGHWYFTLKDADASVSCAMFRGKNARVRFQPEEGTEVLALALPGVYTPQGRYQLIVESLEPKGAGAAALALRQLRDRLAAEGLFDAERKQPLPGLPRRIGVVTSREGAALRDVLRVLRRRFAGVDVLLAPTLVQGPQAPEDIVAALWALDARNLDVILLVRGGGAREDLAAFDDERVVRAIAECATPVVAGVGHEIDTTLADLAADLRAPTPSAAAEVVVRERVELVETLAAWTSRLARAASHTLVLRRERLASLAGSRGLGAVPRRLASARAHLSGRTRELEDTIEERLGESRTELAALVARLDPQTHQGRVIARRRMASVMQNRLASRARARVAEERRRLAAAASALHALSPLAVLGRGYALVRHEERVVRDAQELSIGDNIRVRFARGEADARITALRPKAEGPGED